MPDDPDVDGSLVGVDETTSGLRDTPPRKRGRWWRRPGVALLVLVVILAALDLLGPRRGDVTAESAGYTLTVEYPQVTRAGQPAPLHVTVDATAGFGDVVQMCFCDELFNDLDGSFSFFTRGDEDERDGSPDDHDIA